MGAGRAPSLGDLGEFAVIERLQAFAASSPAVLVGPGDDAAVVTAPDGRVVATTDMLVEGRHFRLDWSTPYEVGRKAAAQNLSDVAAMGARPTVLLVALGAPASLSVSDAEELARGFSAECALAGAVVVGGDLVRTESAVVIGVTALGDLEGRAPVRRSGARAGDRVVVVGGLGGSAAGLAALRAGVADGEPLLRSAHCCPTPPYPAGPVLAAAGATSMIDVSDGFAADLGHVLRASAAGAVVDYAALPRHASLPAAWAQEQGAATNAAWVIGGGEDHALVATVPSAAVGALLRRLGAMGLAAADVGEVTVGDDRIRWRSLPDGADAAGSTGYDHFGEPA